MKKLILTALLICICGLFLGFDKPKGLHPIAQQPQLGNGPGPIKPGSWDTLTVIISYDSDFSDNEADSLKTGGGPYDVIIHRFNAPGEFRRGYIQMNDADRTSFASTADKVTLQAATYWNDTDIVVTMHYFPLHDLPGFFNQDTEVIDAKLTEFWRWANSPYLTTTDTLYCIGGNRSDMLWWQYGTDNSCRDYMWSSTETLWPERNSSTDPFNWGTVGHTAVSTIPLSNHDYVNDLTMILNDPVEFDCKVWAQGQSDGDPNGGFWFIGVLGSGTPSHSFNPHMSTDAPSNRPRLRLTYRCRSQIQNRLELPSPTYASWSQHYNSESPLPITYYDSLAAVDISVMSPDILNAPAYNGFVDSVRARNPDWIPLPYVWAYGIRNDWMNAEAGSLYRELYDFVNDTADEVTGDYWARSTPSTGSNIITHQPTYPEYNILNYGKPGLAEGLAEIYIKHLKKRTAIREYMGFFVDWFEIPMRPWACSLDSLDLDQDDVPYSSDGTDEDALIESFVYIFPDVFRLEAGRDDFLIVPNGTTPKNEKYAGLYDGQMYEGFWHYEPTNQTQWEYLAENASANHDNSRVNPPILLMQAAHDSAGYTSEALAAACLGSAVFSNDHRSLDGIAPIFDNPDRKYNFGQIIPNHFYVIPADSILVRKFFDGVDTFYVRVQGYQDTTGIYPDPGDELNDLNGLPFPYEIIKNPTATPETLSIGSRAFR